MKLELYRIAKRPAYTIGRLYIDGEYFCDTLEDTVRDLEKKKKIKGATAIPAGTYKVAMNIVSPKNKNKKTYQFCDGKVPRLLNVPQFDGILIHIGNTNNDTEGCILVGENKEVGKVLNSTNTFKTLYSKLLTDKNNITITIW